MAVALGDGRFLETSSTLHVDQTVRAKTELLRDRHGNLVRQIEWLEVPEDPGTYHHRVTVYATYEFHVRRPGAQERPG